MVYMTKEQKEAKKRAALAILQSKTPNFPDAPAETITPKVKRRKQDENRQRSPQPGPSTATSPPPREPDIIETPPAPALDDIKLLISSVDESKS